MWLPTRHLTRDLSIRDGFVVTALFWLVLGLFGAIPLWLAPQVALSPLEAIFVSISGLTTPGATVITGIDALPQSLLFYRQFLQWLVTRRLPLARVPMEEPMALAISEM